MVSEIHVLATSGGPTDIHKRNVDQMPFCLEMCVFITVRNVCSMVSCNDIDKRDKEFWVSKSMICLLSMDLRNTTSSASLT
jgi:hypothetical protein